MICMGCQDHPACTCAVMPLVMPHGGCSNIPPENCSVSPTPLQVSRHSRPVLSIAFSPNSEMLATACGDNNVKVWDIDKVQCVHTLNVSMGMD